MKHLEVRQKYSVARHFTTLFSVFHLVMNRNIASYADSRNWDDGIKTMSRGFSGGQTSDIKNLPVQEIAAELIYPGQKKMKNLFS